MNENIQLVHFFSEDEIDLLVSQFAEFNRSLISRIADFSSSVDDSVINIWCQVNDILSNNFQQDIYDNPEDPLKDLMFDLDD